MANQPNSDKIYLYAKDQYEAKYQFLIKKREDVRKKHFNDSKAFIGYSNNMVDIYKNIEDYNPNEKRKILIVFDDMIADMRINKKLNPIVTELFIRGRKLNFSLAFNTKSYFAVPKAIRLNYINYFIMKIPVKRELREIASNNSSDIDFQDFINLYKSIVIILVLVIDNTLASGNLLHFKNNLMERI